MRVRFRPFATPSALGLALMAALLPGKPALAQGASMAERAMAVVNRLAPAEAHVGVWVQRQGSPEPAFMLRGDELFTPASTAKLATASLALELLGPQRRLTTRVLASALPDANGLLRGSLVLQGGGDPSLMPAQIDAMAKALKGRGLRRIAGDLVADPGVFAPEGPGAPGWAHDDLDEGYGAPVCGLSVNRNLATYRLSPASPGAPLRPALNPSSSYFAMGSGRGNTLAAGAGGGASAHLVPALNGSWQELLQVRGALGSDASPVEDEAAVHHPDRLAATLMMEALGRQGVAIDGQTRVGAAPADATQLLLEQPSAPVADLVRTMLKDSDNLYAETLFFQAGAASLGLPGTWGKGSQALQAHLGRLGWASGGYRLVDGSGLSRYDLVTPHQLARLLLGVANDPKAYPSFLVGLPVAGVDGTMARRLGQPSTRGRVRAKTGSMSGVSALAGYVDSPSGKPHAVVVMVDHFVGSSARARALQDALFELVAELDQEGQAVAGPENQP